MTFLAWNVCGVRGGILDGKCIRSNETLSILLLFFHAHQNLITKILAAQYGLGLPLVEVNSNVYIER